MASIQGIYLALFGRPADPAGLAYYSGVTNNGADLSGIGNLAGQKEYIDRFAGMGTSQIVQSIYQSLFGRAGEQTGVDFWVGRLASGALSINNIAIAILDGASGSDKATVDAKIAAADLFTSHLDLPAEQKAYDASSVGRARDYIATIDASHPGTASGVDALIAQNQTSAGQAPASGGDAGSGSGGGAGGGSGGGGGNGGSQGSIFILTGPDASNNGHDVINGTAGDDGIYAFDPKSISSNDVIHGGAGNDTLEFYAHTADDVGGIFAPFIDGVETIRSATVDPIIFDLSHVTGATSVWTVDTDATYVNADISLVLGVQGNSQSLYIGSFPNDVSGDDTLLKLALKDVFFVLVDAANAGSIEHLSLDVTDAGVIKLSPQFAALTEIDVSGNGYCDITLQAFDSKLSKFDASANTAGVIVNLSAGHNMTLVAGGSGSDMITLGAIPAGYNVTTGAGNDTLKFGITLPAALGFLQTDPSGIRGTTAEALNAGMITVTDFDAAHDQLVFKNVSFSLNETQQIAVTGSASLLDAANLAAGYAHAGMAADKLVAFHYGTDTYVLNDGDSSGAVSSNDGLIKLTGVTTDLTATNYVHG